MDFSICLTFLRLWSARPIRGVIIDLVLPHRVIKYRSCSCDTSPTAHMTYDAERASRACGIMRCTFSRPRPASNQRRCHPTGCCHIQCSWYVSGGRSTSPRRNRRPSCSRRRCWRRRRRSRPGPGSRRSKRHRVSARGALRGQRHPSHRRARRRPRKHPRIACRRTARG